MRAGLRPPDPTNVLAHRVEPPRQQKKESWNGKKRNHLWVRNGCRLRCGLERVLWWWRFPIRYPTRRLRQRGRLSQAAQAFQEIRSQDNLLHTRSFDRNLPETVPPDRGRGT